MSRGGLCTFENCTILKITSAGGVLVFMGDGMKAGQEIWLYKDMIHDNSEIWLEGHKGELVVSEKVAIDKGLV